MQLDHFNHVTHAMICRVMLSTLRYVMLHCVIYSIINLAR